MFRERSVPVPLRPPPNPHGLFSFNWVLTGIIFVPLFIYIYIYIYIHTYTQTHTHTHTHIYIYIYPIYTYTGRDSSVGIAARYGLEGPGTESQWGRDFPPVQTGPGAHPASYTMGTGSFLGVNRPKRGVDRPPHLAPKLKKEYSYTSTPPLGLRGLLWMNCTFTFTYTYILTIS